MDLEQIGVTSRKKAQFQAIGVESVEDLLDFLPKSYVKRDKPTGILPPDQESAVVAKVQRVRSGLSANMVTYISADCVVYSQSGVQYNFHCSWFNQYFKLAEIQSTQGKNVYICGKMKAKGNDGIGTRYWFDVTPTVFSTDLTAMRIYPNYPTIRGMSKEYLERIVDRALTALPAPAELIPDSYRNGYMDHAAMVKQLHQPTDSDSLEQAQKRALWDRLLYFALRTEYMYRSMAIGSAFVFPVVAQTMKILTGLPFSLTADQDTAFRSILRDMQQGRRVNALIQGDVGCGKTIIAILLMLAVAENGYQAVLMAPTQILAHQHYEQLADYAAKMGLSVAYLGGTMGKRQRAKLLDGLANGEIRLAVGTQALLTGDVKFKRLALAITDEEHKYGVVQRNALVEKAAMGTHTVSMSATPIPRSLAQTIYGARLQLYQIKTKPAGRQPIITGIAASQQRVYEFVQSVAASGHQAYVVGPMVEKGEIPGVVSVEELSEMYQSALGPFGISIEAITGKTKKQEATEILERFRTGQTKVLIATTVIEVGVNVPTATAIVIHNAERFGLSQLHQLRGRVGRGNVQSVCVLVSEDRENQRLKVLCDTGDGFVVAQEDLRQRGAGDFLGIRQSGTERFLSLAIQHPDLYAEAQKTAVEMLMNGVSCPLVDQAIRDTTDGLGGEMMD